MRVTVERRSPWDVEADVLAVTVPAAGDLPEAVAEVDRRLEGAIGELRAARAIAPSPWSTRLLPARGLGARFVLVVGVGEGAGESGALDRVGIRRLGSVVLRALAGLEVSSLAVHAPNVRSGDPGMRLGEAVELLARGLVEGSADPSAIYRDAAPGRPPELASVVIVVDDGDPAKLALRAERGRIIGEGGKRTRRLAHRSANDVSPEVLADEASDLARAHGLELTVFGADEAERLGMGMFMAVARGSDNPPRFIALRSQPSRAHDRRDRLLAMVGKGVTFDTGGISLKPAAGMGEMKADKTGACTVINAIATVAQLAPEIPLLAVAPAVENMPGPHSTRPGDVVRAMNGKTVEINNTDAEGRLILGDALAWAEGQGATHLVDVATLTGAMARALGRYTTGGFASDDAWWAEVAEAAAHQAEPLWRLPLTADLRKDLDTPFADLANVSGQPEGGAITAALFLREFVTRPWVHLDIAGTAFLTKADPFSAKGSTGVMHATLVELALAAAEGAATEAEGTAAEAEGTAAEA